MLLQKLTMYTRRTRVRIPLLLVITIFGLFSSGSAASAHIHTHQHTKPNSNERTEDGAFSPRDMDHYAGGEHHQEFDHEAILGSVKEAEEFDKLPMKESKRRLGILLTKMDLNNDTFIERNELKAWILRSFSMLSTEESQDRLEETDENEDGKITWNEILQDTYGSDPEDLAEDYKIINDDKQTFEAADIDGNGYLDKEEFKAYTHPEETPRMFPLLLRQALDDKDTDKDGFISFQEFIGNRAKTENKEWLLIEKDKFDYEHDKNGDGRLDSDEILSWLVPSNEEIADDEVDHLFAASDDDHDNRLSFDEILDHHDAFVGSEATDYGEHLQDIERFQDEL
ncbi:reticulocalbin-2 isoform X2 [Hylaeus anthracinus]|uniref:reticulocalbin-2 isoform X2 n=1 Tax=Hylaeus volcanicus TaxID=313075 RepID=UPI0023B79155|nr:reticulocalbin-2 isoform X2 [Hylaeus volcanicus]XP_054013856.1 reticulocalbin-2 isoform X2 [Hylaeus anthracinus]